MRTVARSPKKCSQPTYINSNKLGIYASKRNDCVRLVKFPVPRKNDPTNIRFQTNGIFVQRNARGCVHSEIIDVPRKSQLTISNKRDIYSRERKGCISLVKFPVSRKNVSNQLTLSNKRGIYSRERKGCVRSVKFPVSLRKSQTNLIFQTKGVFVQANA